MVNSVYLILTNTFLVVLIFKTDFIVGEVVSNEYLTTEELYEKYGLKNPFELTEEEKKYEKRRHNLEERWGLDVDVSQNCNYVFSN